MKSEKKEIEISRLLQIVDFIQDNNDCSEKEISYNNDTFDEVKAGYYRESDSDYQQQLIDEGFELTFEEAKKHILTRIHNLIETIW